MLLSYYIGNIIASIINKNCRYHYSWITLQLPDVAFFDTNAVMHTLLVYQGYQSGILWGGIIRWLKILWFSQILGWLWIRWELIDECIFVTCCCLLSDHSGTTLMKYKCLPQQLHYPIYWLQVALSGPFVPILFFNLFQHLVAILHNGICYLYALVLMTYFVSHPNHSLRPCWGTKLTIQVVILAKFSETYIHDNYFRFYASVINHC